jgi:excisionase family DNA binding protein
MDNSSQLVDEIVSRVLPQILNKIEDSFENATSPEKPIGTKEAAEFLEVSSSTLNRWTADRLVPYHQTTGDRGRLYFFKSEIVEYIKTGRVKTVKELGLEGEKFFDVK